MTGEPEFFCAICARSAFRVWYQFFDPENFTKLQLPDLPKIAPYGKCPECGSREYLPAYQIALKLGDGATPLPYRLKVVTDKISELSRLPYLEAYTTRIPWSQIAEQINKAKQEVWW